MLSLKLDDNMLSDCTANSDFIRLKRGPGLRAGNRAIKRV